MKSLIKQYKKMPDRRSCGRLVHVVGHCLRVLVHWARQLSAGGVRAASLLMVLAGLSSGAMAAVNCVSGQNYAVGVSDCTVPAGVLSMYVRATGGGGGGAGNNGAGGNGAVGTGAINVTAGHVLHLTAGGGGKGGAGASNVWGGGGGGSSSIVSSTTNTVVVVAGGGGGGGYNETSGGSGGSGGNGGTFVCTSGVCSGSSGEVSVGNGGNDAGRGGYSVGGAGGVDIGGNAGGKGANADGSALAGDVASGTDGGGGGGAVLGSGANKGGMGSGIDPGSGPYGGGGGGGFNAGGGGGGYSGGGGGGGDNFFLGGGGGGGSSYGAVSFALASGAQGSAGVGGSAGYFATDAATLGANGGNGSITLSFVTFTTSTLPTGIRGGSYSTAFAATGGAGSYVYTLTSAALPAGLTLNSATGALSGTPSVSGTFTFEITAQDTQGAKTAQSHSITINEPNVVITPGTLPSGTVASSYSQTVTASGGIGTYSYSILSGSLPAGLTLNDSTGALTGTPTAGGTFNFTLKATDSNLNVGTQAYALTMGLPTIAITPASLSNAIVGSAYSHSLSASGGTPAYSFTVATGTLPAGLSLSGAGVISGTPTAGGTFNFMITATDSSTGTGPYVVNQGYALTVNAPTIAINTTLPAPTVGVSYTPQTLSASGGTAPYTFSITSGALPLGMTMSLAGVLSGKPTAAGAASFTVTATDASTGAGPYTGSQNFNVTIGAATIQMSPASGALSGAQVGVAYAQTMTASGGTAPYAFSISSGALPAGLSISASGQISGTPTAAGTYNFSIMAKDSSTGVGAPFGTTQSYQLKVSAPVLTLSPSPSSLPAASVGVAYSQAFTASGGTASYSYLLWGALPDGLSFSPQGVLSGTPTQVGSFSLTIQATDSSTGAGAPFSISQTMSLIVGLPSITISPTHLSSLQAGVAFSRTFMAANGNAPYIFSLQSGVLPNGLTLSPTGTLYGKPTQVGAFPFTIKAVDSSTGPNAPYSGTQSYTALVSPPVIVPNPATLASATVGSATAQTLSANGGTAPYTFAITSGTLPAGITLTSDGNLSGTPTEGGTFNITIEATDSTTGTGAPFKGSQSYAWTVDAANITLAPTSLPAPQVGKAYSQVITASGGTAPYSFAVTAGALPAGLTLSSSGTLSGTPTAGGAASFTITVTDSSNVAVTKALRSVSSTNVQTKAAAQPYSASLAYTFTVAAPSMTLSSPASSATLPDGKTGSSYAAQQFVGAGGTAPYSFAVTSGALPTGMSLSSTGALSGTPTVQGDFTFTITATDSSSGSGPYTAQNAFSLHVAAAEAVVAAVPVVNGFWSWVTLTLGLLAMAMLRFAIGRRARRIAVRR